MPRDRSKPDITSRRVRTVRSVKGTGRSGDAVSTKLGKLRKKLGNQELDAKLQKSGTQRDALLDFIGTRLKTIHGVQEKEIRELTDVREWYQRVHKGKAGFTMPEPTRWHESAKLYKQAAQAICNGNLGKGAQIIERAVEAEDAAFRSAPVQVRETLTNEESKQADEPVELGHIGANAACPRCAMPGDMGYADLILNVQMELDTPSRRPRRRRRWFDVDEEEDKDEEKKEDKAESKGKAAPAAGTGETQEEEEEKEEEEALEKEQERARERASRQHDDS